MISVAAELAGVHPQTLRIYERKGLLEPARTGGGSRRYSDEDIDLLRRIQELTEAGPQPGRGQARARARGRERAAARRAGRGPGRAVAEVERTHRKYRRDLVPLSQAVALFGRNRSIFTDR